MFNRFFTNKTKKCLTRRKLKKNNRLGPLRGINMQRSLWNGLRDTLELKSDMFMVYQCSGLLDQVNGCSLFFIRYLSEIIDQYISTARVSKLCDEFWCRRLWRRCGGLNCNINILSRFFSCLFITKYVHLISIRTSTLCSICDVRIHGRVKGLRPLFHNSLFFFN